MTTREPTIVVNGRTLTEAEAMAVRVAVSTMRIELRDPAYRSVLGPTLADGYDRQLASVERTLVAQQDIHQWRADQDGTSREVAKARNFAETQGMPPIVYGDLASAIEALASQPVATPNPPTMHLLRCWDDKATHCGVVREHNILAASTKIGCVTCLACLRVARHDQTRSSTAQMVALRRIWDLERDA